MTTPFKSLAPQEPRIVDIYYAAMTLPCISALDVTDSTDSTDQSDVTDGDLIA